MALAQMLRWFSDVAVLVKFPKYEKLWENMSIDFILELPRTEKEFDSTLVVVVRFSRLANFVPLQNSFEASKILQVSFRWCVVT